MGHSVPALYPLRFEPIYKEKVWGGRTLTKLSRTLPDGPDAPIGESWELADLDQTSPSGGGGGAERSVVADGPLAGCTLHDLIHRYSRQLMGRLQTTPTGGFPLLVKFLDARQNLSVQVHPSPEYARTHPDAHLKSEAWYILDAEPDAVIYKGVHEGISPEQFRAALSPAPGNTPGNTPGTPGTPGSDIATTPSPSPDDLLIRVPVKPGDCHYLPSGTCHALGAGVLVAEVQTPSDTTFRVYDWGRTDRQLHVEQAMACIHFGPPDTRQNEKRSHIAGVFTTVTHLVTCEHFRIEKVRMTQGYQQEIPYEQPVVWIVLEGGGLLSPNTPSQGATPTTPDPWEPVPFTRGQTLLIPAGLGGATVSLDHDTAWLEVSFPQAMSTQIA